MKKVLIIYNKCWSYRQPIFELIGEKFDLTVGYSLGKAPEKNENYKVLNLPINKFGRFVIHKDNLVRLSSNYDVVIAYGDISWLSLIRLAFVRKRNFKLLYWTIGVRASYRNKFNDKTIWDRLRFYIYNSADALLLYSKVPLPRYKNNGWDIKKIFIANNTVKVESLEEVSTKRNRLLFIGTLYKEKGIELLLNSYKRVANSNSSMNELHIIGGGDGLEYVKNFISTNNLTEKIVAHGPIYDESLLKIHFSKTLACISPNQAGLSVLKSMGYGVPFITHKDAITGGELYNIENNVNGVIYEDSENLFDILIDINQNASKYLHLGKNAKLHYENCRKPSDMARGITDAISFVLNNRK